MPSASCGEGADVSGSVLQENMTTQCREMYRCRCNCRYLEKLGGCWEKTRTMEAQVFESNYERMTTVAITSMSKYYLCGRVEKELHGAGGSGMSGVTMVNDKARGHDQDESRGTSTPWDIDMQIEKAAMRTAKIWNFLKTNSNTECTSREPWIAHHVPKYIEVLRISLRDQILGWSEMEMDLFDVVLRRLKECEDKKYMEISTKQWRHYIESDFLGSVLAGWFKPDHPWIKGQFVGEHIKYNIRACKLIFFPAIVEHRWVCYAWNMNSNKIKIFDPMTSKADRTSASTCHQLITTKLKTTMATVANMYFVEWKHAFTNATTELLETHADLHKRMNRSGVVCVDFCHRYRGGEIVTNFSEDNQGKVPPELQ